MLHVDSNTLDEILDVDDWLATLNIFCKSSIKKNLKSDRCLILEASGFDSGMVACPHDIFKPLLEQSKCQATTLPCQTSN